jgi:hypothetical protein
MGRTPAELEIRVCKAIRLLAEGWEPAKVAQAIKVRQGTLAAWMENDDFKNQLDALCELGRLKAEGINWEDMKQEALRALRRLLHDEDSEIVVRAARAMLVRSQRQLDLDDKKRLLQLKYGPKEPEFINPDGGPLVIAPWAERNPVVRRDFFAEDDEEGA